MKNRIVQLDFLKCVFILHVIMIHLVYLGQTYPWLKGFFLLYTTPVFFVISGFLAHVDKPFTEFCQKVKWWLVPYIVMEGLYIILASILPINEHIDRLHTRLSTQTRHGATGAILVHPQPHHQLCDLLCRFMALPQQDQDRSPAAHGCLHRYFCGLVGHHLLALLHLLHHWCGHQAPSRAVPECLPPVIICHHRHHRGHYFLAEFLSCPGPQPVAHLRDDSILADGI